MADAAGPTFAPRPIQRVRRRPTKADAPGRSAERSWWDAGADVVVGLDEVGRGAWAGPLVIGAAVIPRDKRITGVRDSKMLRESEREAIVGRVAGWCRAWSVGVVSHDECDALGMSAAQRLAATRALDALGLGVDAVLVDGTWDFTDGRAPVDRLVKGDARCLSIAAASVLAKVMRDRWMRAAALDHPWWAFESNKGYPCPVHRAALAGIGPSAIHRRSWVFMDNLPWPNLRLVRPDDPAQGSLF